MANKPGVSTRAFVRVFTHERCDSQVDGSRAEADEGEQISSGHSDIVGLIVKYRDRSTFLLRIRELLDIPMALRPFGDL